MKMKKTVLFAGAALAAAAAMGFPGDDGEAPMELHKCPQGCKMTYNPKTTALYLHVFEWPIKVLPITFSDRVEYAQFLHDASEVQIKQPRHVSGTLRKDVPASLMLPVRQPNVEIPVVEMFLRDK